MTITTFATLKTAIATRLARSDMTSLIPDFVYFAHDKMMHGDPLNKMAPLRFSSMLTSDDLTPASGEATLPTDYLELKRVYTNNSTSDPLIYRPPEDWYGLSYQGQSGPPKFFTIEGTTIKIAPMDTTTLKVLYYARLDQLSADADTNAIITKAPHTYLYGALAEAYDHIRQHDRAQLYRGQFVSAVTALNNSSDQGQMSGGPLIALPSIVV